MKKSLISIFAGMAALSFVLFTSCEIGLGPSVDTEPPSLEITNPPVDSIVRGSFALSGSWKDDGSISSVTVKLTRTDGKGAPVTAAATVSGGEGGKGSWSALFNPEDGELLDGAYEAFVEITDSVGHKNSQPRTFTIDNTPPVIVLQRPGTKITETPDAYGQTFTLNGMGADDNSIDHIDINIYSDADCTTLLKTITKSNVPPTIQLDVAVFEEGVENDYATIYGSSTKNGAQTRYCTITAYDNAKHYPAEGEQTDEDKKGNSTSRYYLYDDIYSTVLDLYTITDVYKMLSGTYLLADSNRAVDTVNNVKNLLDQNKILKSNFSLNPENNPLFFVNGKDVLKKDGSDFTGTDYLITNGSGLVIEISTGLDGISLNAVSLRPYLLPCDANGNPSVANIPENRIYLCDAGTGAKAGTSYKFTVTLDTSLAYADGKSLALGNTYIFGVEGSDQRGNSVIPKGGDYGFKLASNGAAPIVEIETCVNPGTGDNAAANQFTSDTMIYVPRYKPEVSPQQESSIKFKGRVFVDEGTPVITMTVDSGDSVSITPTQSSEGEFTFERDVPVSSFSEPEKAGQHNIVFNVTQGLSTRVTKSIMYQPDAPSISLSRVEPTALNYYYGTRADGTVGALVETGLPEKITVNGSVQNKKYLNGKNVKLNVTIIAGAVGLNDRDDSKKAKIEFFQNGQRVGNAIAAPTFGETDNIDTTVFAEGELLIRITAFDMAGNKAVYEDTYFVKQDTDVPVILPKNNSNTSVLATQADVTDSDTNTNTSINIYSANQTVSYKLIDDDGLDSVYYEFVRANAPSAGRVKFETIALNGNTDYQLDITMPETPDIYIVKIESKDINDEATTGSEQNTKRNTFYVRVTASAPVLEPIELNRTTVNGSDTISPIIKIRSDQKPFRLLRIVKNKTTGAILADYKKVYTFDGQTITLAENDNNGRDAFSSYGFAVNASIPTTAIADLNTESPDNITDTIDISGISASGNYTICYKVLDKNTKTGEASKDITVDLGAPNITEVKLADSLYNADTWYNSKTLSLSVKAADGNGESGMSSVDYSTNGTLWTSLSYDNSAAVQAYTGSAVFGAEGATNTLYIRAKDNAGNIKYFDGTAANPNGVTAASPVSVNVKIDTTAPLLSVTNYQVGTSTVTEMTAVKAADLGINTSITELNLDRVEVVIKNNGTALSGTSQQAIIGTPAGSGENKTCAITIPFASGITTDGVYDIEIKAIDKANNPSQTVTKRITRDHLAPTVTIDNPDADTENYSTTNSGNNTSFRINASDGETGVGVSKIYYAFSTNETAPEANEWKTVNNFAGGDYTIDMPLISGTTPAYHADGYVTSISEGVWYLYAKAEDKSGNINESIPKRKFHVDKAAPSLTFSGNSASLTEGSRNVIDAVGTDTAGTSGYVFSGTVSDTNQLTSLVLIVDGVNTTITPGTDGTWTHTIATGNDVGQLRANRDINIQFVATDIAGKTTTKNFIIYYDTAAPELEITSPAANEPVETASKAIKGTVVDNGYGVDHISYTLKRGTTTITSSTVYPVTITGEQWYIDESVNNGKIPLGTTEGSLTLEVTAHEKTVGTHGGRTSTQTVNFYYDKANPGLEETGIGTTGTTTNTTFVFAGKAWDSNELESITIKCGTQTWVYGTDSNITLTAGTTKSENAPASNNWTATFVTGTANEQATNYIADGTKEFTIIAKDISGKEKQLTRTVVVDTNAPTVSEATITTASTTTANTTTWYKTRTLSISGTVSDSDGGSGVAKVECTTSADDTGWTHLSISNGSYSGSVTFAADGNGKLIRVKATDVAGNTAISTKTGINIDTVAPTFPENLTTTKVNGRDATKTLFAFDVTEEYSGVQASDFTVLLGNTSITLVEAVAGDADTTNNRISIGAQTGEAGNKKYPVTIQIGNNAFSTLSGSYPVKVTVTDQAGNVSASTIIKNLTVDRDAPEPTITSHNANETVNKTITFAGRVTDPSNSPIVAMSLTATSGSGTDAVTKTYVYPASAAGANDGTISYESGQWSVDLDTTEFYNSTATQALSLSLTATDDADNTCTALTRTLTINQNSDRPVLSLTNLPWDNTANSNEGGVKEYNKNIENLTGIITDDDGIAELRIAVAANKPDSLDGYNEISVNSTGAFSVSLGSNGSKTLWIYVKDTKNGVFETAASGTNATLSQPYLVFNGHKDSNNADIKSNDSTATTFIINNNPPQINKTKFGFYGTTAEGTEETAPAQYYEFDNTNNYAGGTVRKNVVFEITAIPSTNVPIDSVSLSVTGVPDGTSFTFTKAEDTEVNGIPAEIWRSAAVDVKSLTNPWTSGTKSLTYTVVDKSGLSATSETKQLVIDNAGPTISLTSPGGDEVTGEVTLTGYTTDTHTVDALSFKVVDNRYYSAYNTLNDNAQDEVNTAARTANTLNAQTNNNSFTFVLNGTAVGGRVNPKLPTSSVDDPDNNIIGVQNSTSGINLAPRPAGYGENDDTRQLTVVFYAKDSLGNETFTPLSGTDAKTIIYNPFADRPKATVSYPVGRDRSDTDALSVLNGLIRITGYAEDNVSVRNGKVYLQFDLDNDGDFDATDLNKLKNLKKNETETIYTNIKEGISTTEAGVTDVSALGGTANETAFWGYPAIGTNSWNCLINQTNEMQIDEALITGSNGRYMIGVRAVAIDDTGVLGSWSAAQYFIIDKNAPIMSAASFRNRATGAANSTDDIVRTYVSDMYLSGTQTLIIPVSDTSGIVKVNYTYAETLNGLYADDVSTHDIESNSPATVGKLNLISAAGASPKEYEVEIPVSLLATELDSSQLALKVTVYQGNSTGGISGVTAYERYVFNFDNTAPTVDRLQFNGRTYDTDEDTHKVYNSNGSFTIAGKATDEGSGFERFAFYFYKNSGESSALGERIYDPVTATTANTASVNQPNFINVKASRMAIRTVTDSAHPSVSEKIYGITQNLTIANDGLTMTGYTADSHINPGSLVEIGGVWYKIASISGGTITLSSPTTLTGPDKTVFFAYIMSLDNTETERGTLATESQGDGDKMVESVVKKNTSWEYDGQLYSNYIPDGPKNLRTFVWDKAGNLTIKTYDVQVENNAPRLTKVWLATDLNDNSKFEDSEFTAYNILSKTSGNVQSSFDLQTGDYGLPRFRVLKDLAVVTEFVGGNAANSGDDIYLAFNNDVTANPDNGKLTKTETNWHGSSSIGGTDADIQKTATSFASAAERSTYSGSLTRSNKGYVLRNEALGYTSTGYDKDSVKQANGEFSPRAMSFTFWDSTEDTTPGTDSCYCYLKISDLIVLLADNEDPNISINPFFWNTPDENSLYKNSYLNGHIDLSKDLMEDAEDSSTYVKPKASGKISVRGSASDAHFLSEIWMKFSNFTVTNALTSTNPEPVTGAVCVAKRVDGEWRYPTVASTGISGGNIGFKVTKETSTQQGHYIEWQLDLDTSAMSTGCLENAVLNMWAIDKADSPHHSAATPTTGTTPGYEVYSAVDYNIPNYEMSVVPYISKVQDEHGNDAVRSRLGRYPVKTGSTITIKGFNFPEGNPTVERWKTGGTTAEESITTGVTRVDSTTVTMTAPAKSGYIKLVWTGAETPNNDNTNAGYNISKGYIASENNTYGRLAANQNGTNFWTDDVYLSVWNNTVLSGSTNPWDGKIKQIDSKDLRNNTYYKNKSGNGIDAITGAVDTWSATWSSPDMILYTDMGNGAIQNHPYRTMWSNSQAAFTFPVRTMDWAIIGGKNWYVVRDDYVGNSSANVWGPGLFLGREGFNFPKNGWNSTNQPSDNEAYNIIERLGSNMPAETRAPSTGYDSVQEQFQEPHITGWYKVETHNDGDGKSTPGYTYIYISYYDKFAHCLKYAAYREDWSNSDTGSTEKWGSENGSKNLTKLARAADHMTAETVVVAGVDRLFSSASSDYTTANGADCGLYNDIVVDPIDHFPVIIYYNRTTGTLEVAHGNNEAPVTANYKTAAGAFTDTTEGTTGWTKTKNINPVSGHDFGRYVSAEVDAKGNIHATAQDFTTGALYYIFLEKSGRTYTPTYKVIDAVSSDAAWTDIRLDNDSAANTYWYQFSPVISYMDNSKKLPKVAYVDSATIDSTNHDAAFEALADANSYEAASMKTSVLSSVYEGAATGEKSKIGISFNSDMLALDFLRGE